jgi:hypothetical protein
MALDPQHISDAAVALVEDIERDFGLDAKLRNVVLVPCVDVPTVSPRFGGALRPAAPTLRCTAT